MQSSKPPSGRKVRMLMKNKLIVINIGNFVQMLLPRTVHFARTKNYDVVVGGKHTSSFDSAIVFVRFKDPRRNRLFSPST